MYIVQIKNHSDVTRVLITGVGPVSGPFSLFCIAWRSKRWLFHPQDKSGPSFTSSAPSFISQNAKDGQTLKRVPTLRATISIRSTKPAILDWPRSDPGRRSLFSAIAFGLCHLAIALSSPVPKTAIVPCHQAVQESDYKAVEANKAILSYSSTPVQVREGFHHPSSRWDSCQTSRGTDQVTP